ncbi:hypothetical protein B0H13DRAFT_2091842 [Mycena leptocephala]|nr:hypothetical protein B0H13DRAFT_2091842 [Mycena leptocephala]
MSSTITDDLIDPQILAMDPTQRILARVPNTPVSTPPPGNDDDMEEDGLPNSPPMPDLNQNASLVAYGRLVKRQANLSDASAVAFDQFCQAKSADERQALLYATVLQMLDLGKKNDRDAQWSIPADLNRKIIAYVRAFVFSPTTVCYRGLNVNEHILKAMRECNVKSLPDEDDLVAVELVLSLIGSKAIHYRNIFKTKVKQSMASKSPMRNIAVLSHKLLKDTGIKLTLQFYQWVAFIRWCLREYPALSDEEFWPNAVDLSIAKFRQTYKTKEELSQCFTTIYEDDKAIYGKPEDTEHKTVDFATTPEWQTKLTEHTNAIQPQPAKKHKFTEVDEEDNNAEDD